IYIWSAVDNNAVTIRGLNYQRNVTAQAGLFVAVQVNDTLTAPAAHPVFTEIGVVSNSTFRVESQYPIIVYCYFVTAFGSEAWTPLPVESWGKEYYAASRPGEVGRNILINPGYFGTSPKQFQGEICIVAADSTTHVTI